MKYPWFQSSFHDKAATFEHDRSNNPSLHLRCLCQRLSQDLSSASMGSMGDSGRENKALLERSKVRATCIRLTDSSCQDFETHICAASSVDQLCTKGASWLNCLYSSHLLPFLSQWSQRLLAEAPVYVMWTFSHLLLTLLTSWGTGWHGSVSM